MPKEGEGWKFTDQFNSFKELCLSCFPGLSAVREVKSCLSSWRPPLSDPSMPAQQNPACVLPSYMLCVNLETWILYFRNAFRLFQAIFNLYLSQQVWDNLRKNHRRPLKALDQSVGGKKKKGKSAKLFFLYLCLFTKMSFFFFFCIIPVKTMYISTVFNNQSRHSS